MWKRLAVAAIVLCFSILTANAGWQSRDSHYNNTGANVISSVGMITPTLGSTPPFTSGTATFWVPAVGSSFTVILGNATNRKIALPVSGTLFGLNASLNTALTTASISNVHNGVTGIVGCNFSSGLNCNSGAASEHYNAGDFVEFAWVPGGTWNQAASPPMQYSWLFQADTGANSGFLLSGPVNANIPGTTVNAYQGFGTVYNSAVATNEAQASSIVAHPGTIAGMFVNPNAAEHATNNHIYTLVKNGVSTGITCAGAAGSSTGCCVNVGGVGSISGGPACTPITAITVATGDTISANSNCASGACNAIAPGFSLIWNPNVAGEALFNSQGNSIGVSFDGLSNNGANGSQVNWQVTPQVATTMALSKLIFCVQTAPTGVTSRTATTQFSTTPIAPATNSALTTTFSSATPCPGANSGVMLGGSQDTTHSVSVGPAYAVDNAFTAGGSPPGAGYYKTGMVANVGAAVVVGDPTFVLPTGSTLKFLATAANGGSDSNDGLAATVGGGHGPWATPNHAMKCGEVIIAGAGDYSSTNFGSWGTVSNCPSTTGGIDGTGGIQFAVLLCGGSDLEACHSSGQQFSLNKNNWAIEGWKSSNHGTSSFQRLFEVQPTNNTVSHHTAFINDIAFDTAQGFHWDCGSCGGGVNSGENDYFAVVGSIAQNATQENDGFQGSALDAVNVKNFDAVAGTHVYFYGNFAIANQAVVAFDAEAIMFDTWDNYTGTGIVANNIAYASSRYCFQPQYGSGGTSHPVMKIYNNTCYSNLRQTNGDSFDGEYGFSGSAYSFVMTYQNNIGLTYPSATSPDGAGGHIYAMTGPSIGSGGSLTIGGTGSENILKASATTCESGNCDPGNNVAVDPSISFGINFYENPTFANTADLLANRIGVPNCTGFTNVTACMGWNAVTSTLTTPSVVSDLAASCAHCSGKGYQKPSTVCAANADYPTWLKGIVYLHWNGSIITESSGLVTKPCGL